MAGAVSSIELPYGSIELTCPVPECRADLMLLGEEAAKEATDSENPAHHIILMKNIGIYADEPPFSCPDCGFVGAVDRNEIVPVGRISIPPSGAIRAYRADEVRRSKAIQVEIEPDDDGGVRSALVPAEKCPYRRTHAALSRKGDRCACCGFDGRDDEGDKDIDWQEYAKDTDAPEPE